ncbi:MAG: tetratricopeptide repeat protein [Cyanobacteria bacterium]|nr:tetratricopeptide repeat protein [Cyanobacteriota bacterium]
MPKESSIFDFEPQGPDMAEASCRRALKEHPDRVEIWLRLAALLRKRLAYPELLESCDQAALYYHDSVDLLLNRSWALHGLRRSEEALAAVDEALALVSDSSEVLNNKANLLKDLGRHEEALDLYNRALALQPDNSSLHTNRGFLLAQLGKIESAREDFEFAISLASDCDQAIRGLLMTSFLADDPVWTWLGDQPLNLDHASPTLRGSLIFVRALFEQKAALPGFDPIPAYLEALRHEPRLFGARLNLAEELRQKGHPSEAIEILEKLLEDHPGDSRVLVNLGVSIGDTGAIEQALAKFEASPTELARHNAIFYRNYDPKTTRSNIKAAAMAMGKWLLQRAGFSGDQRPVRRFRQRQRSEPLRVGFVGGDFHLHPVGLMLSAILAELDSERIQPFIYSNSPIRADWMSRRFRLLTEQKAGLFTSIHELSTEEQVKKLGQDNLDILIDLAGHTLNTALPALAHRPAPLQLSWLGYFSTTGLETIDAVILDPGLIVEPVEEEFSEKILLLNPTRFCYFPMPGTPPVIPGPLQRNQVITFGSFNNTTKLNREVLALWRKILSSVPDSRLLLKWKTLMDAAYADSLRSFFAEGGVAADRLDLRPISPHLKMLAQYGDVDIALDPFPFSGGFTSLEALWMGVPVITLPGERVVSRQTYSFLACIDALELVARDPNHYGELAIELANDQSRLQRYRCELRGRLGSSSLCQPSLFAEKFTLLLEQAYSSTQRGCPLD